MRRRLQDNRVRFYVGDVRDAVQCEKPWTGSTMSSTRPRLKQVPSCEFFPLQAVATNVNGSDNVIRAAHDCGVKSVVCLSTDKAVYPVNAMGLSKAMMERVAGPSPVTIPSPPPPCRSPATATSCIRAGP